MKKMLLLPMAALLLCAILFCGNLTSSKEITEAKNSVIRLHVRAADDSPEEQALKLEVRDRILSCTGELLQDCETKEEALDLLNREIGRLENAGKEAISARGKDHDVTVTLNRERFEYREYDGFFLPEGEYDSLIVEIGPGEGQNWWCVVFPAACYLGAGEIETDAERMPDCFRTAKDRARDVSVRFWLWDKIRGLFDGD